MFHNMHPLARMNKNILKPYDTFHTEILLPRRQWRGHLLPASTDLGVRAVPPPVRHVPLQLPHV